MSISLKDSHLVVIDFETLGTDVSNCAVMALGVCIGNANGKIFSTKEFIFPLAEQFNDFQVYTDYEKDDDTVPWWALPDKEEMFKNYLHLCFSQKESTVSVIEDINNFIFRYADMSKALLVANAPDFDTAIFERLYDYSKIKWPFNFRQNFDVRTADKMMGCCTDYIAIPNKGIKHNALDDAMYEYAKLVHQIKTIAVPF